MEFPLVTFVSPCYNHSKYIIESLDSIRNQTYPNIEHIIIDDCSKDDSVAIIEDWIRKHNYKCTFIKHSSNKGISYTLNESIRMAKGEFWTGLATDDFIVPDRTSKFVKFLQHDPTLLMVVSDCKLINSQSEVIKINGTDSLIELNLITKELSFENDFGTYPSLLASNHISPNLMCRRKTFDIVGLYDENLGFEDWDMWLRISVEKRIGAIKEYLCFYRVHNMNSSKGIDFFNNNEVLSIFLKQYKPSKKRGYRKEYEELYENFYFRHYFNPFKKPKFLWHFIQTGPPLLFVKVIFKKIWQRIF